MNKNNLVRYSKLLLIIFSSFLFIYGLTNTSEAKDNKGSQPKIANSARQAIIREDTFSTDFPLLKQSFKSLDIFIESNESIFEENVGVSQETRMAEDTVTHLYTHPSFKLITRYEKKYANNNPDQGYLKQTLILENPTDAGYTLTITLKHKVEGDEVIWDGRMVKVTDKEWFFKSYTKSEIIDPKEHQINGWPKVSVPVARGNKLTFLTKHGQTAGVYDWKDVPRNITPLVSVVKENNDAYLKVKFPIQIGAGETIEIDPNYSLQSVDSYNSIYQGPTASYFGYSIAVGDVNGDAKGDLVIGAYLADQNSRANSGSVYVLFSTTINSQSGSIDLSDSDNYDIRYDGAAANSFTGFSVDIGDVNEDGEGDVVFGAHGSSNNSKATSGSVYVVTSTKLKIQSGDLDLSNAANYSIRYDGAAAYNSLGWSVAVGDVNEDGNKDLVLGASYADFNGKNDSGSAYVLFSGRVSTNSGNIILDNTSKYDIRHDGFAAGDRFSTEKMTVGDVNGDGYGDLVVGAVLTDFNSLANSGSVYVIFSSKLVTQSGNVYLNSTSKYNIRYDGNRASGQLGTSVAVGDVDGDSLNDLIMGAPYQFGNFFVIKAGKLLTQSGDIQLGSSSIHDIYYRESTNGFQLGKSVVIGDFDGDSVNDLILGMQNSSLGGQTSSGSVFILKSDTVAGHSGQVILGNTENHDYRYDGNEQGGYLGMNGLAFGDINGDSKGDLVMAAPVAQVQQGRVYVIFGDPVLSTNPADAYNSNDLSVTVSSPGTQGVPGNIYKLSYDDDGISRTALSQTEGGYDSQVFRFRPDTTGISSPVFVVNWDGYGEDVVGYDVTLNMWNFTTSAWEEMDSAHAGTDGVGAELYGYKIGYDYIDGNGDVWAWVKADNVYLPPTITGGPTAAPSFFYVYISFITDVVTDGQVAFDTVSHAAGSWEDYSNLSYVDDYTVNHNNIYLSGLGAGTTYYYRLRTATQTGDILETGEYSFSTVPCFVADTPVLMADGMKKMIQDVAVGDKVKSWDMDKNELVDTVVEEVWSGKQGDVYAINEDVKATWAHPFWTKEVGWASINPGVTMERYKWQPEELKVGYHIMDSEGGWVEIRSVEALDGEQMTYNLSKVSGHHNYFAHGLLAHNKFCAFLFAKDEKLKEEVFEFVTLGVFEEPGNINSRLVNDRIFEENDGYSYLKLKNNTNKFVLRIPPHQMDYIDYVGLKVVDELNVDKLSERDQKLYKNGKLKQTLEYNLALKDSSSGIELMNKADNRYYKIADEEGIPYPDHVELTFEELPKEDARYTREIVFVEKGYYEPFEGAKIWVDQAPFNQEEWRARLDKDANEQRLAYILNRETMKHNNIVKLEHQLEGQHQRLNQRFTRQLTTKKISLVVQEARYLTK